jgi:hypothetical protein
MLPLVLTPIYKYHTKNEFALDISNKAMYTITTQFCDYTIVPLDYVYNNGFTSLNHIYDVTSETHTLRFIRLLLFQGVKNITIHTETYENEGGWVYALHNIYSGYYPEEFKLSRLYKRNFVLSNRPTFLS